MNYAHLFLKPKPENIPDDLKLQPCGVWIPEPREGQPGKFNKAPRCPRTGQKIGADKPDLFGTFDEAVQAFNSSTRYAGIGVLLTGNGIVGVDIDDFKQTFLKKPEVKLWVQDAIEAGVYGELSPSGTGLRFFMLGSWNGSGRKSGKLEIYQTTRFLTVTGHRLTMEDCK